MMTIEEAANRLYAQSAKVDEEIDGLWDQIEESTRVLTDTGFSNGDKYKILNSIEYIVVRLRVLVEREQVKVKRLLANDSTPAILKPHFLKRSVWLGEISNRITLYQDDVKVATRCEYAVQSDFIKYQ